MTATKEQK